MTPVALSEARAAFGARMWATAYASYAAADRDAPLALEDLERYAASAYLVGADEIASELWARAHHEALRRGNVALAVRYVFWLVLDLFNRGEWARGNGWLVRALRLLDEQANEAPERGLLLALASRNSLKQGDVAAGDAAARHACELAGRHPDPDLAVFSRLAAALVHARGGRVREAAALFDEIMVAVTVDDVSPIGVGVVYCAVIDACQSVFDWSRAREWTAALSRWCSAQPDLVPFRGRCLVHRAEIMRLNGAWPEAMAEAEQACQWSQAHESSFKYPLGPAYYELAEIQRLRGDFAAAEAAYRRASEHGQPAQPGLARLHLAQGKLETAHTSIRRVLQEQQSGLARADVLLAAVDILIAAGDVDGARAAAAELSAMTSQYDAAALRARAAHAAGAVQLAAGDAAQALTVLREAWAAWQELEAPYEAAQVRVLLALVCQQLGDAAGAELELDSARRIFERLTAMPDVARVDELLRAHHKPGRHALTARELQVIGLIAKGQTNHTIAQQLCISERTVDRHVSNILLKLQLPSRAAATAYAYEHGLLG